MWGVKKRGFCVIFFLLLFLCTFADADKLYSENWFSSGDRFNLDGKSYEIMVSDSGSDIKILLEHDDTGEIFEIGECFSNDMKKICFTDHETSDNGQTRVLGKFYEIDYGIKAGFEVSGNKTKFLGEEFEIDFIIEGNENNTVEDLYVELYLPEDIIVDEESFEKANNKLIYEMNNLEKGSDKTLSFTTGSNEKLKMDIGGEISYRYEDEEKSKYLDNFELNYKKHFEIKTNKGKFNHTFPFSYNLSIINQIEDDIELEELNIYLPKNFNFLENDGFVEKEDKSIESHIFGSYVKDYSLEKNKIKNISLILDPETSGTYPLYIDGEYTVNNENYKFPYIKEIFEIPEKDGVDNESQDNESQNSKNCNNNSIEITSTIENNKTYFPGRKLEFLVYAQNKAEKNITWLKLSLFRNNSLMAQNEYSLKPHHKIMFKKINDIVPFKDKNYEVLAEFKCQDNNSIFKSEKLLPISIANVDNVLIIQDLSNEEIYEGETVKIELKIENEYDNYIYNISAEEILPSNISVEGVTNRTFSLKNNKESNIYTYYITPKVSGKNRTLKIKTNVYYKIKGKNYSQTEESFIDVKKKNNMVKLDYSIEGSEKGNIYEPYIIDFNITNEGNNTIKDFDIEVPPSEDYDLQIKDLNYPAIPPDMEINPSFKIIPFRKNISIRNITFTFYNKFNDVGKRYLNFTKSIDDARSSFHNINFSISLYKKSQENNTLVYGLKNEGEIKAEFKILDFDEQKFRNISIVPGKEQKLKYNISDEQIEDFEYEKSSDIFLKYTFLNDEYSINPNSINKHYGNNNNKSGNISSGKNWSDNNSDINNSKEVSLESKDGINPIIKIMLSLILIILPLFLIFILVLFFKKKRNSIPKIKPEHENEVLNNNMQTSNVIEKPSDKKSLFFSDKKSKNKEKDGKAEELKPSQIFSFDEYEEYRKKLENNINKKDTGNGNKKDDDNKNK
ncbi:MAG: hypothetical protein ACQER9_03670 [Nanobdellota archaeon]